jgi:hypothetical protein
LRTTIHELDPAVISVAAGEQAQQSWAYAIVFQQYVADAENENRGRIGAHVS